MKRLLTLLLLFCGALAQALPAHAQNGSIAGRVVDAESGDPLPGVNVMIDGSMLGAATDLEGQYTIPNVAPGTYILKASFIGYRSRQVDDVPVTAGQVTEVNFTLPVDVAGLEEVVVVGYGEQQRVNLTGSVKSVSGEQLVKQPVMRASVALQGQVPGLTVTRGSGQPGSDGGTLRIRGVGTLGDSNPLVLVDGIESSIDAVDPKDIASISVLKDAASASIYGARAANGVILVTTKRGRTDRFNVTYSNFIGVQRPTRLPEFMGGYEFMTGLNEANRNEGKNPPFSEAYINEWLQNHESDPDSYPNSDWQDLVMKDQALEQQHNVSVNGGTETVRLNGSISYMDQDGLVNNSWYKRYGLRLNTDVRVSSKMDVAFDVSARQSNRREPAAGMWRVFYDMNRVPPVYAAQYSNGWWGPGWNGQNPLAYTMDGGTANTTWSEAAIQMRAVYRPIRNGSIDIAFAPVYSTTDASDFDNTIVTRQWPSGDVAYIYQQKNQLSMNNARTLETTLNVLGNYSFDLLNRHHVKTLVGLQRIDNQNNWMNAYRDNYRLPQYQQLNAGSIENQQNSGSASEWGLMSYFGRLNYDFRGKYLLEGNLRYDGSSRFAEGRKWGVFPSFSAGWRVSEEPFMQPVTFIDDLKLRGSWGRLGNQNIGLYPYASTIALGQNYVIGGQPVDGAALTALANQLISWESTEMTNFGVDVSLLDYKLELTADYYVKNTSDILLRLPIPVSVGLTAPYQNAGKVRNTGLDLSLTHRNQIGGLYYTASVVFSDVRNEVIDLKGTGPYNYSLTTIREGESMNAVYGYQADGLFQSQDEINASAKQFGTLAPGDIKYVDQNGDGVINADDRVVLGNTIPRNTFGLNLTAQLKGFDFSVFLQGVGKRYGYLNNEAGWAFYNGGKLQKWQMDHWTPDNPDAAYPRYTFNLPNNQQVSSFWMTDASYVRLKNINVGYTLPRSLFAGSVVPMEGLRLYFTGQDLLSWDAFRGYDPEAGLGDGNFYPFVATYTVGLEARF